jgi:hypothetical protein
MNSLSYSDGSVVVMTRTTTYRAFLFLLFPCWGWQASVIEVCLGCLRNLALAGSPNLEKLAESAV